MVFKKTHDLLAFAGLLCLLLSVSARAQAPQNCDEEASFGRSDKMLFGKYCGACHTISGRWKRLVKTPLGGLFEREQLVTGEPPTEDAVREIIANGRPILMPGFKYTLTPKQMDELIQFLKSARCNG
jgi:mono/diheme cytochrome c family protein